MNLAICENTLRASDTHSVKMLKIGQLAGNLRKERVLRGHTPDALTGDAVGEDMVQTTTIIWSAGESQSGRLTSWLGVRFAPVSL